MIFNSTISLAQSTSYKSPLESKLENLVNQIADPKLKNEIQDELATGYTIQLAMPTATSTTRELPQLIHVQTQSPKYILINYELYKEEESYSILAQAILRLLENKYGRATNDLEFNELNSAITKAKRVDQTSNQRE